MKRLFILGCERSGSTWVANIFDAHPDVVLYMEPFAGYAQLFPGFPNRNQYLTEASESLVSSMRKGWESLETRKHPLFTGGRHPQWLRSCSRLVLQILGVATRLGSSRKPLWLQQYELLNLNQRETPGRRWPRKAPRPGVEVVKELRLNFKVVALKAAFPQSRCVVCLRHPGAQINSILRLFDRGHLGELRGTLAASLGQLGELERLNKFSSLPSDTLPEALASWWLVNHDVLLQDLDDYGVPYLLAQHEEISEEPLAGAETLLQFAGLPVTPEVESYVRWSSTTRGGDGPVNTARQSSTYYRRAIAQVAPEIRTTFAKARQRTELLHPLLDAYLANAGGYST